MDFSTIIAELTKHLESFLRAIGGVSTIYNMVFFIMWLVVGRFATQLIRHAFIKLEKTQRLPIQINQLLRKVCTTLVWFIFLTLALSAINVDVVSILGAAGVLGVAIGFASQTSLSNVICGIFIISERGIKLGDYIKVDGCEGTVESINLMAVQLRQVDNSLIRVPNQNLIQNPVTNITGNSMRRCDMTLGLDYTSDLDLVKSTLMEVVKKQERFLDDPAPAVFFLEFADSTLNVRVGAWCKTEHYHAARYAFAKEILAAFDAKGISMAFPCRTIYQAKQD